MSVRIRRTSARSLANLTDEEVVSLARRGSRQAVEHLLARYRGLVEARARAYFVSGADHDDVVQEGMIGLFKAIRDYQAERLVRFRAFAEVCVTRQIISAVKSAARQKHLPLNHYVPLHRRIGDGDALLADVLAAGRSDEPEAALLSGRVTEFLERYGAAELSELENEVIRRRLEGKSYQQMAAELKCGPKCVDNALQRAKRKIWSRIAHAAD
jgi:RNA polymerase sporulation-specific sigma factor